MATMRANPRLQVGSASWIAEERTTALQLVNAEAEEFGFSARNEVDWLNEHMAEIFSSNQVYENKLPNTESADSSLIATLPKYLRHLESYGGRLQGLVESSILWKCAQ